MRRRVMRFLLALAAVGLFFAGNSIEARASNDDALANNNQIAVLLLVDYARTYGFQTMMARLQLEADKAELGRDEILLKQKEVLYNKRQIPLVELELAQLKDTWNRRQVVVSEKNLDFVSAQYEAMSLLAKHFGSGTAIPIKTLYDVFRRGWDAGCDKGPDEVAAMKAKMDFLERLADRSRQLLKQGNEALSTTAEKETQLAKARADYQYRLDSLERCRSLLFPSLEDILAVKP